MQKLLIYQNLSINSKIQTYNATCHCRCFEILLSEKVKKNYMLYSTYFPDCVLSRRSSHIYVVCTGKDQGPKCVYCSHYGHMSSQCTERSSEYPFSIRGTFPDCETSIQAHAIDTRPIFSSTATIAKINDIFS